MTSVHDEANIDAAIASTRAAHVIRARSSGVWVSSKSSKGGLTAMAKRKRGTGGREYGKMPLSGQDHLAAGQKGAVGTAAMASARLTLR
jgi:hypothetical protein